VVETSFHSLSVGNGGSGKRSARRGPVYRFFKETMPKSSARQRSLHTLAQHLMAQLPSPYRSHAQLRWRLTGIIHPNSAEGTPRLGWLNMPLLGEFS
jgi:hypothetical protein